MLRRRGIVREYENFSFVADHAFQPVEHLAIKGFSENSMDLVRAGFEIIATADVHGNRQAAGFDPLERGGCGVAQRLPGRKPIAQISCNRIEVTLALEIPEQRNPGTKRLKGWIIVEMRLAI